jgi:hypothetical protein
MAKEKKNDFEKALKYLSKNYWATTTVILAILLVIVLISGNGGATISAELAGQKVLAFANNQGAGASLVTINDDGSLYEVVLSIEGQEIPVYVTKDGTNLVPSLVPLESSPSTNTPSPSTPTPTSVPKSDKPKVELFIMSHCPYGTQAEKGILPTIGALGDTIDFELKFVYYAMHPTQGEVEEQLNQYCIQKEQNDKFIKYLTCFLEASDGAGCLVSEGINTAQLETCTTATDAEFNVLANLNDQSSWLSGRFPKFDIHKAENDAYGIGGSPTLVINGVQSNAGRDSASYLSGICAAFNTAPEECNTELPATSPGPGFGWSTTQAAATAAQCA